ncbi:hypothetical protein TELCIR_25335, partial [Teladorsagia circumcincta]
LHNHNFCFPVIPFPTNPFLSVFIHRNAAFRNACGENGGGRPAHTTKDFTTDNVSLETARQRENIAENLLVLMDTEGWTMIARNSTSVYTVNGWSDHAHQERCSTSGCRSVIMPGMCQSVASTEL